MCKAQQEAKAIKGIKVPLGQVLRAYRVRLDPKATKVSKELRVWVPKVLRVPLVRKATRVIKALRASKVWSVQPPQCKDPKASKATRDSKER